MLTFPLVLAFIVGKDRERLVSGKKLSVTGGHDFSLHYLLPFRKKIRLVGKVEALLLESG